VQSQILNLLHDIRAQYDVAMLFISHDLAVVHHLADRVAVLYLGHLVEIAPREAIFANPAHPYTATLLAAVPRIGHKRARHPVGEIPSPLAPPPGCVFHTRCPIAQPRCAQDVPVLRERMPGHRVACHFPLGVVG
jgi:oligopeptide/dipeptide ABC transporter ATP-binding protein